MKENYTIYQMHRPMNLMATTILGYSMEVKYDHKFAPQNV